MIDDKLFEFIIRVSSDERMQECFFYLNHLFIPLDYNIRFSPFSCGPLDSVCTIYNRAMEASDAKYKIYMSDKVCIRNRSFLSECLDIFDQDDSVGMIGTVGWRDIPYNAECKSNWDTGVLRYQNVEENTLYYSKARVGLNHVQAVDGSLIVTNRDLPWREDLFKGSYFFGISQGIEFMKKGWKAVVPRQFEAWCALDGEDIDETEYDRSRRVFCDEYKASFHYSDTANDLARTFRKRNQKEAEELLLLLQETRLPAEGEVFSRRLELIERLEGFPRHYLRLYIALKKIWDIERNQGFPFGRLIGGMGRNSEYQEESATVGELVRKLQYCVFLLQRVENGFDLKDWIGLKWEYEEGRLSNGAIYFLVLGFIFDRSRVFRRLISAGVPGAILLTDKSYHCPLCGHSGSFMYLEGSENKVRKAYGFLYADSFYNKEETNRICPRCFSNDSDCLTVFCLEQIKDSFEIMNGLLLAPSESLRKWAGNNHCGYSMKILEDFSTSDSLMEDLGQMNSDSYDIIICDGILNRVDDDMETLFTFSRVLNRNGKMLLRVPLFLGVKETDEEVSVDSAEAIRRFGDASSCRIYNKADLLQRCSDAGFIQSSLYSDITGKMEEKGFYLFQKG
ncbi:MAG: glycosyltransferase family protein [Lachnospiraceae bacterium]|nr:glycosyltransferase family protein [Lachnospiraceae bacterium]